MKTNNKIAMTIIILCVLISINTLKAQNEISKIKRWNVDFSILGAALFKISQAKVLYTLNPNSSNKSQIGLGFLIQPESTSKMSKGFNTDGIYSAKMATVAYRQYLWKGLNFEEAINFGQGAVSKNVIDSRTYKEFVVFAQSLIGYKLDILKRDNYNIFLIGQGGFGYAYNANHWPTNGSPSFFGLGDLKIGINF
jgi:hypothetical protein